MPAHEFEFGDVRVTVEIPEGLTPNLELHFHTHDSDYRDAIAALGGVAQLDPIDPRLSAVRRTERSEVTRQGVECVAMVYLPDEGKRHPVAALLRVDQDSAAACS